MDNERELLPHEKIWELKGKLMSTDYLAIKFFEGWLTEEEYAPVKEERQAIRDEINEIESLITESEVNNND